MKKRLISLLLAFSMMLTFLPAGAVSAFAEETADDTTKGTLLTGGETITGNGKYQLNGNYNQGIKINTEGSVEINVTGNVTVTAPENANNFYFITIEKADSVTINGNAQYPVTVNDGNVIYNKDGKLTVNGGKYICNGRNSNSSAFTFSDGSNRVENVTVENVTIESKYNAIWVGRNCDSAVIKSSNITAEYTRGAHRGGIVCFTKNGTLDLDHVTVHALEGNALELICGTITIEEGEYTTSAAGCAIHTYPENSDAIDLTITGGTYKSESQAVVAALGCYGTKGPKRSNIKINGSKLIGNNQVLWFEGDGAETLTIDGNTTLQSTGGTADAVVVGHGQLIFNLGTIEVPDGSECAALRTYEWGEAIVNGGTFKGAKYDIYERNRRDYWRLPPCRVQLNAADNVCNVYLEKDRQIDVAQNYTGEVTIECADPSDGRQLTTATTGEYPKNLNLTSANEDYLVGYKKTADGKEYRCLSKKVGVTINGLKGEIKAEDPAEFTVTLTHENSTGTGILTFGDKNSEIEYKDKNGAYQPMPEGGLPIDLSDVKEQYAFRIAPKETGKQTLTAAVKKGENELARDEKDFVGSEMPILTLKDGVITSVTVPGKNGADPEDITEIVKKNANEDGSFHVPEGATVSVAFDKDAFADSGLKFGHWDITGLDDPNAYQNKESFDFEMPAKAVTLKAMTQDASIEDDEPDIVGPIVIGTTVVVGGAVLGYQAYSLGAEFAGKLMALPYFPSNRSALAMMLWEDAGKPMPESELLYPDVGQEERDMDLQHAARWAMENELIPDLNDEGTAPEEMKFYPDNAVSKIDVLNAWQKAQELKQNA